MTPEKPDPVAERKEMSLWFLGSASLTVILVIVVFALIDSRKVPQIVFSAPPTTTAVVDVRGAVATPGIVTIRPGDRMIDVINEAGGFTAEADTNLVNLSTRVRDGQLVVIPTQAAVESSQNDGKINVNTASVAELDQLPGIGPVKAEQIIAHREANGPFTSIDELANVDGISPSLLETIRPLVRVSGDD